MTLKDLVLDGLTMSLDTYCVGEITGDEAWEFIKAAFSGHRGSRPPIRKAPKMLSEASAYAEQRDQYR